MAICFPCEHTVDEKTAPKWAYKDMTFFFCSDGCELEVKEEPEKWLVPARAAKAEHRTTGHNTGGHTHDQGARAEHGHEGHGHDEDAGHHDPHAGHDHGPGGHAH